ncbi:hypothetical protein GCM10023210_02460 [Chryseobacterium ginsengisoli]|uniref:Pentapeptide repeat-containing protein n=2 Tax=Chryseobacterium ginsengisoli TaxID=363853 RepID=A0ABP9LUD0_9FLAO
MNCSFVENEITKAEFYDTSIELCTFNTIKLGWSYFGDCFILNTTFDSIELDNVIFADSKFKAVNFNDVKFNIDYPVKINDHVNITNIDQLKILINV